MQPRSCPEHQNRGIGSSAGSAGAVTSVNQYFRGCTVHISRAGFEETHRIESKCTAEAGEEYVRCKSRGRRIAAEYFLWSGSDGSSTAPTTGQCCCSCICTCDGEPRTKTDRSIPAIHWYVLGPVYPRILGLWLLSGNKQTFTLIAFSKSTRLLPKMLLAIGAPALQDTMEPKLRNATHL